MDMPNMNRALISSILSLSLFFLTVFFAGCGGRSVTLSPGEVRAAGLADGLYRLNTVRTGEEEGDSVFYRDGRAKVTNEAGGTILVELLDEWGGWFRFQNRGGTLEIVQSDVAIRDMARSLKGEGVILAGNQAKGTCQTSVKMTGLVTRDWRHGTWTLVLAR